MDQYEHHSHISITRHTREGVTRTDVHITRVESANGQDVSPDDARAVSHDDHDCFNPESCCDAQERALIAMMRAYLRPQAAPECLFERLHRTLDACCREEDRGRGGIDSNARDVDVPRPASGTMVVRRVHVPGTEIVTITDLSVPEGWTFPTYPDAH